VHEQFFYNDLQSLRKGQPMRKISLLVNLLVFIVLIPKIHAQTTTTSPVCIIDLIPPNASVYTWETVQFLTTSSGVCNTPCYTWEISQMGSMGSTIDNNGLYTAGSNMGTDIIVVSDPCNNDISDSATVNVATSTTTTLPVTSSTTSIFVPPEGATYLINGSNPLALTLEPLPPNDCTTVSISLDPAGVINTPLITAGFWLEFDVSQVAVVSVTAADDASGGPWDSGFTSIVPDAGGPGTYFVAVGQFGTVAVDAVVPLGDVELCCQGPGVSQIVVRTIPNFDTVVGDTTVWDPQITPQNNGIIVLAQVVPACSCGVTGPAVVEGDPFAEVTAQYTAANAACNNLPAYIWSDDCTLADIDQTGLLTVPPPDTGGETCTITVIDTANIDINSGENVRCNIPIEIFGVWRPIHIALGRECPGEEIDDPAYNRPGRRGLVATCGDIIDFTVCDQLVEEPCYEWTIEPAVPWMQIVQIDDCCWRLTIGENCEQLTKTQEFEITVTDPCNGGFSDSIILEVGKVVINLGNTAVNPESGTADVTVDLINPDHHLRALSFDITAMGDDNLVCTGCTADPDRALEFTCSAAEQPNGDCRVVMYSTNPAALIAEGAGQVATVLFDAEDPAAGNCVNLMPINEQSSDQFNEDLCTCGAPGEVCFKTCGDIYPQNCVGGPCVDEQVCGDGVVDLFDILEAIDIILGLQVPTPCQIDNLDAPNGMPPYCGNPPGDPNCETDGDIVIFDVLVIIDKALGKVNCCDYCNFAQIY
jgi:hypothetical protein